MALQPLWRRNVPLGRRGRHRRGCLRHVEGHPLDKEQQGHRRSRHEIRGRLGRHLQPRPHHRGLRRSHRVRPRRRRQGGRGRRGRGGRLDHSQLVGRRMGEQRLHLLPLQVLLRRGHQRSGVDARLVLHPQGLSPPAHHQDTHGLLAPKRDAALRRHIHRPQRHAARPDHQLRALQVCRRRDSCRACPRGAHAGTLGGRHALRAHGVRLRPHRPHGNLRPHPSAQVLLHREDEEHSRGQWTHLRRLHHQLRGGPQRRGDSLRQPQCGHPEQGQGDGHQRHRAGRTALRPAQPATDRGPARMDGSAALGPQPTGLPPVRRHHAAGRAARREDLVPPRRPGQRPLYRLCRVYLRGVPAGERPQQPCGGADAYGRRQQRAHPRGERHGHPLGCHAAPRTGHV